VPKATRRAPNWGADEEIEQQISSYRPTSVDAATWVSIRPFVLASVRRLPFSGWAVTVRTLRVLTKLTAWSVGEGIPLDPEQILDPDTIERFAVAGLAGSSSRSTYRADLRRIGPLLTTNAPWEPRPPRLARRQVAAPYTETELEILRADAKRYRTESRRRAARALLALGAGAGLDGRWATRVRAKDVLSEKDVVTVRVGPPSPRAVPVLAEWEEEVLQLAATAGDEYLVGGYSTSRNRAGSLVASLEVPPGHPRLSLPRMRSTWLLFHLNARTRLPELAAAAGLQGVTVLSDLLSFVQPMEEADSRIELRGKNR